MILGVFKDYIVVNIRNQLSENRLTKKIVFLLIVGLYFGRYKTTKKSNGGGLKNYPLTLYLFYRTIVF